MNFYKFIIARLNGKDIEKEFDYYLGLVRKGIAGFIIFGGELDKVRRGVAKLQKEAGGHLIISSDLERGLGQQLKGGTTFPPAMAIAGAITPLNPPLARGGIKGGKVSSLKLKLLRNIFKAIAVEARYAGINTIFAPVFDINTNPKNPIISTRAFGEDAETVSFFGNEMIKIFQKGGITACGKHFPGHGDTEVDSHIKLPVINKSLRSLEKTELAPFRNAVKQGVKMIMLGHLKVSALEPSGIPVSLSDKAISYLRNKMGFKGIVITDALNMGGIGRHSEEKASLMALNAGVDFLLHPSDPDRIAEYLREKDAGCKMQDARYKIQDIRFKRIKTRQFIPDFRGQQRLSEKITRMSIKIDGLIKQIKNPLLVILNDDVDEKGQALINRLKQGYSNLKFLRFRPKENISLKKNPEDRDVDVIVAVFSGIHAWKGGASPWLMNAIRKLENRTDMFVSFGSPYLFGSSPERGTETTPSFPLNKGGIKGGCRIRHVPAVKVYAYWDSDMAQKAVAEVIMQR